jgi:lauroyl/myristoyl acyltransferase
MSGSNSKARVNLQSHFKNSLTASEIDTIAREHTEFKGRLRVLYKLLPRISAARTAHFWEVAGLPLLDNALAEGRGVILLTGHFGYAKLITPILRSSGYDVKGVFAKPPSSVNRELRLTSWSERHKKIGARAIESLLIDRYERNCVIPAQLDVRPIFKSVENNQPVMIAADGLKAAMFLRAPFLGSHSIFPTGVIKIATSTRALILPVFAKDERKSRRIQLQIYPPVKFDENSDLQANVELFARILEQQVLEAPHLWYRWNIKDRLERMPLLSNRIADRWNGAWWLKEELEENI